MSPRDFITAWRDQAPWVQDFQVEQDLVITRALVEIFADPLLRSAGVSYGSRAIGVGGLRHSAASYEHISAQSRRHAETLREALRSESWEPKGLRPRDEKAQDQDLAPLFRAEP